MPESKADNLPSGPGLWRCPNCWRGWMRPKAGQKEGLGTFLTECDFCHFEAAQTQDSQFNDRSPGRSRRMGAARRRHL